MGGEHVGGTDRKDEDSLVVASQLVGAGFANEPDVGGGGRHGFLQQPNQRGKIKPRLRGEVARWCHVRGKPCLTPYTTPSETSMISDIFTALDTNKSGLMDIRELVDCVQALCGDELLDTKLMEEYAMRIDSNGSGKLSLHEFTSYLGTCYLLEPPEDTNPLFIEMDEMLLKLTDPNLRGKVAKLLFSRANTDISMSKLFSELSPRDKAGMLTSTDKLPITGKQEYTAKADKPYPYTKPFQQENTSSLKRRARFNDSLDTARAMREEAKQKLMRYRTNRRSGILRTTGDASSAPVDPKSGSGFAPSEGEATSTVEALIAKRGSLTAAEVAKLSMLLASDSSETAWDDGEVDYDFTSAQRDGTSSAASVPTMTPPAACEGVSKRRLEWEGIDVIDGEGRRVKEAAAGSKGGTSCRRDDFAVVSSDNEDDSRDDGESEVDAQVSIYWNTAASSGNSVEGHQQQQQQEAAVFGGFGGTMGWHGSPYLHDMPQVQHSNGVADFEAMGARAVAAALAGMKNLGPGGADRDEPSAAGRVLHSASAPPPYAREYYATADAKEMAHILSKVEEMVTPPFVVPSKPGTPSTLASAGISALAEGDDQRRATTQGAKHDDEKSFSGNRRCPYTTRHRSASSPAARRPAPPSHFRVRHPPGGRAARSAAALATERGSAARAAGWASPREATPPLRSATRTAGFRPSTAPINSEHLRSAGVEAHTALGEGHGGDRMERLVEQGRAAHHHAATAAGHYPFLTLDAHLSRHGFKPIGDRDAALSVSTTCYSRRRYVSSPGPRWRNDSELSPAAIISQRGVHASDGASSSLPIGFPWGRPRKSHITHPPSSASSLAHPAARPRFTARNAQKLQSLDCRLSFPCRLGFSSSNG